MEIFHGLAPFMPGGKRREELDRTSFRMLTGIAVLQKIRWRIGGVYSISESSVTKTKDSAPARRGEAGKAWDNPRWNPPLWHPQTKKALPTQGFFWIHRRPTAHRPPRP
jgi:hypothetical protein